MSYKRTRKQARLDEERTFDDMVKQGPRENASTAFNRKAYKSIDVMDYVRKIHKGGGAGGQEKIEKVHTEQSET